MFFNYYYNITRSSLKQDNLQAISLIIYMNSVLGSYNASYSETNDILSDEQYDYLERTLGGHIVDSSEIVPNTTADYKQKNERKFIEHIRNASCHNHIRQYCNDKKLTLYDVDHKSLAEVPTMSDVSLDFDMLLEITRKVEEYIKNKTMGIHVKA